MVLMAFFDQLFDRVGVDLDARFADTQNVALHLVHQGIHFALVLIYSPHDVRTYLDHAPQQELLLHDVEVITEVRSRGHCVRQSRQIRKPADLLQ